MFDKFSERHIGVCNEKDLKAMLDVIGVKSTDELEFSFLRQQEFDVLNA